MKRITKKQIYINSFIDAFADTYTIKNLTIKIDKDWIRINAECHYKITRKDITNKADAIWYGHADGNKALMDLADRYM